MKFMSMTNDVIVNKNRQEYIGRAKSRQAGKELIEENPKNLLKDALSGEEKSSELPSNKKVDLGSKTKDVAKQAIESMAKEEVLNLAQKGLSTVGGLVSGFLSNSKEKENISNISDSKSEKITNDLKSESAKKSPGIFFMTGFDWWGLSDSSKGGLSEMSDFIDHSQKYSWSDKEEVLEQISKLDKKAPLILIGHSFGGDSVVDIANELNSIKHGFRGVDLLVTLDSVGMDNDIIPENVVKNLNFIGDRELIFNDGPNIAKNVELTTVINELRREDHSGIDNAKDIQKKILDNVDNIVENYGEFLKKEKTHE
ncbi:MAG: alpha/beta hydrolase [Halobacteriovoraceae bacterium]|nr:alpha/beta hydrolase [Halobacteriovoraceae bacterium]